MVQLHEFSFTCSAADTLHQKIQIKSCQNGWKSLQPTALGIFWCNVSAMFFSFNAHFMDLCWTPSNISVLRQGWSRTLVPCVTWGLSNVTNWRDTVSLTQVRHPLPPAPIVLPPDIHLLHALHIIGYVAASNSYLGRFLSLQWCALSCIRRELHKHLHPHICTLCMKWHDDRTKRPASLFGFSYI